MTKTEDAKLLTKLAAGAVAATLLLAGCNTTEGFGQDVENTGEAIEDTAEDIGDDM